MKTSDEGTAKKSVISDVFLNAIHKFCACQITKKDNFFGNSLGPIINLFFNTLYVNNIRLGVIYQNYWIIKEMACCLVSLKVLKNMN